MWPSVIVLVDSVPDDAPRGLEGLKCMLPDTLFFERSKEPFNDAVLLRCIGRNENLLQTVVSTRLAKPTTLENQSIVAAQDRRPTGRSVPKRWRQAASMARSASFARLRNANL